MYSPATVTADAAGGTTDADIDAVPGLRSQLERRAEGDRGTARSDRVRVVRGTTQDDIDAVPGLRAQLERASAPTPVAAATAAGDSTDFQWGDAAVGAAGAAVVLSALAVSGLAATAVRRRDRQSPRIG
jgi:hypothetical protein